MDIKKLQALVIGALEDVKAQDIRIYETGHLTSLFDRIAIASGTSNRQTKALAASVRDKVKGAGGQVLSVEGETTGEWVLVDLGDMIVHIMQPTIRAYYRLEEIWGEKEVKLGAAKRLTTASKNASAEPVRKTTRHITSDQPEAKAIVEKPRTAVKKTAVKKTAAKTTAVKKTAAKKPATKTPAGKTVAVKKPRVAVKKTAATKTPKAPVKRSAAKTVKK